MVLSSSVSSYFMASLPMHGKLSLQSSHEPCLIRMLVLVDLAYLLEVCYINNQCIDSYLCHTFNVESNGIIPRGQVGVNFKGSLTVRLPEFCNDRFLEEIITCTIVNSMFWIINWRTP